MVGPSRQAASDAEAEDEADDAASRRAARSAYFALVAVDEVMVLCGAEPKSFSPDLESFWV